MPRKRKIDELKRKIKEIEDYLGPRVKFSSDEWPRNKVNRWLMEYLILIKKDYYRKLKSIKRVNRKRKNK